MEPVVRVLIVEDDPSLAATIGDYLGSHGCVVEAADDGVAGLHRAAVSEFDVIVLDLVQPRLDGISVCRRLRRDAHKHTPVLILSAHDTLDQRLVGFQSGADDYMSKPFALAELSARVGAIARRGGHQGNRILRVADLTFNIDTLTVARAGVPIPLNAIELKLLRALLDASPFLVTRHELHRQVWGDKTPGAQALCTAIHKLRIAIDGPFAKALIRTRQGIGYRIVDPDVADGQSRGETTARRRPDSPTLARASLRA